MCHSGMNNRMQADKAAIVEGVIKRVLLQHLVPSWRAQGIHPRAIPVAPKRGDTSAALFIERHPTLG
jgi:hypothetical protein